MSKKVLVLGNGGREHAIVWKLLQSKEVGRIYVNEGTIGMKGDKVEFIKLIGEPFNKTCSEWCKANSIDLVVVGPEAPLVNGIADELKSAGINCFGPTKLAARIESDKSWAKEFFDRNGIATARWASFTAEGDGKEAAKKAKEFIRSVPWLALVVKASGLAFGKGVVVASTREEACEAVDTMLVDDKFGSAGRTIVVEELLQGPEVSVLGLCDGLTVRALLPAQDHKRIFDGDLGGNTGGMGAYCPCPLFDAEGLDGVCTDVLQRTVDRMREEGTPFVGVLYAGLMLTAEGPKVLEFNCRFGDPETQVILPLLDSDLFQLMLACCRGELGKEKLRWKSGLFAVGVVMASRGYPDSSSKGDVITGLPLSDGTLVFHSGIAQRNADIVTNGGRVLIAVSLARDLAAAAGRATAACRRVRFDGAQFRRDIGHKGIARSMLERGGLTYKDCGVDIVAGDRLVGNIKGIVGRTSKLGVVGGIGGFGGIFDPRAAGFVDPLLVSGTDGVGTKLEVAKQAGDYSTLGQDLVAMCVNDVLCCGAKPLFFLDYLACGRLEVSVATDVVAGVAEGCRLADCALIGGETAEMPGLYADGDFDLAGFAVGAVERAKVMPRCDDIAAGDVVLGLSSSGLHSNGFSLVRKIVKRSGLGYKEPAPFGSEGKTLGQELVTPTRIYVKPLLAALQSGHVKAIAHITGGGLTENIPRVLRKGLGVRLDSKQWPLPPVFGWLAAIGGVGRDEMLRTFNCGLGIVMVVAAADKAKVVGLVNGEEVFTIGVVENVVGDGPLVNVTNFTTTMSASMSAHVPAAVALRSRAPRRVAVLISGSGTNLQALMDATRDVDRGIGAEIVLVVSNKPGVMGLTRADSAGIATKVIPHGAYESRELFEAAVHETLVAHDVEIVCLAGFMRVLTSYFVSRWRGRLINIHPALLPLFKGVRAQRQALEAGVRITGCTAHFVQEDVDAGAILVQEAVPIEVGDTEESLSARLLLAEHRVFPRALQLVALDKVRLSEDNTLVWQ